MPQFIISYVGGNPPASQEEGQQHMLKYRTWLAALGDSVVSPANPFKNTHTVSPDGTVEKGSGSSLSGYTIVNVESIEDAIAIAKECPFLDMEGTLEVSELLQMPG